MENKKVVIIGAGPSGLFCALKLLKAGLAVDLYDQSSGVGKKFLIAGNGGLNLTHSEKIEQFASRYYENESLIRPWLDAFSPQDLRDWCLELGIETFVGSSGRVFPKELKAGKFILKWLSVLKSYSNFNLFLKHKLISSEFEKDIILNFALEDSEKKVVAHQVVYALGGASWKKTGSDGEWINFFPKDQIETTPFLPMNCGFEREWSDFFKENIERDHLKHVEITFNSRKEKGDLMLTPYGIEGGVVYALSRFIRDEILNGGKAEVFIDLLPNLTMNQVTEKLAARTQKQSLGTFLKKSFKLRRPAIILLNELLDKDSLNDPTQLGKFLKNLPLVIYRTRPIDEAISTSGGVLFYQLDQNLMLKKKEGVYFIGEMLDFEAPTGGCLLQAAFSSAYIASKEIIRRNGLKLL